MDREVSIRIRSSFEVEGADEAQRATAGLREEFQALAQATEEAAARLAERFPQAVERARQTAERPAEGGKIALEAPETPAGRPGEVEFRGYRGQLWADIARQALEAGDLDVAGVALARAGMAREPDALLRRLGTELLARRRAVAPPEEENPLAERLMRRVESMLPTVAAQIASGRYAQAERTLEGAEAYLEQARTLQANTEALERLYEALSKHRETLEEQRAKAQRGEGQEASRPQVDPRGALEEVGEIALGRALGGAGATGSILARISRFLGPWGWLGLGVGATVGAVELAGGMAREGRQEAQAFLELNRALGLDYPTWVAFLDVARGRPFATRAELEALSYTARDAGQFAASYGMVAPARGWTEAERVEGLFRDVLAGLRLARYTGADEGQVASVLRLGARAGVVDPGEAETLAGILFQAVREGTREGVSAAETFQNVERYLQGLLAQGVTANERSLAFYAALLDRLSETQDRALMGEVGARAVGNILEGLTRTGQPGLEVLAFRALGGPELPTAREVGLEGAEAREYERLREVSPLLAARFLLEEARSLNPEVIRRMAAGFEAVMGGRPDLEYLFGTEFLGLSYEQVAALRGRYGSVFRFLQQATPAELQAYLEARPQDVGTGGVARQIAEAGYRREFLEEETSRLKSLLAAQQDLDVGLRGVSRSASEAANALGALARGIEQDPVFGPLLKGYRQEQGLTPVETVPILGDVIRGLRRAVTPRPRTTPVPRQGPVDVGALEAKAQRDAQVNRVLRGMGATITLGVGAPYAPELRRQYPKLPPRHQGVDLRIGRPGPGDPVRSPVAGEVARVGYDPEGYGRYVVLRSGEYEVLMAHLQEVRVRPGQKVDPGEVVGLEGETGAAKGAHLHLELRRGGKAITDQEAFWEALARLTAPPAPKEGSAPASIQIGGSLTVHVQGLPPEVGARVAKGVEEVVTGEVSRWGQEAPSPYNEGRRRGSFR